MTRSAATHLEPLCIAGEVRTPPPYAVHVESVLVNSQLASEVRPVLVAEAGMGRRKGMGNE